MNPRLRRPLAAASLGVCAPFAAAGLDADQAAFVDRMVVEHGFERAEVTAALEAARHDPAIVALISRPAEALPWHRYRKIFLTENRIAGGVAYWRANRDALARAEERYGVPARIIVAIIGVETAYGANTGRHRVADALKTLGFGYPKRADFFRSEFEQFLLLAREEGLDPLEPKGSYAGAMGKAQFIPSSYRRLAVDFDGDGRRNLWSSDADAIGSVANYLATHGWRAGEPVAVRASAQKVPDAMLAQRSGSEPTATLAELEASGIFPRKTADGTINANIISLQGEDEQEYWVGFYNFYAITRYNHSTLYAMAVNQLAEAVQHRKQADTETDG